MNDRKTLLIADDNRVNRLLLVDILKEYYNIIEAEDGQEAIDVIEANKEDISVVLLDIIMPKKDGFQVISEIRNRLNLKELPVIVITVKDDPKVEVKALDLGADDLVVKPVEPKVILQRVKNMIEKKEMHQIMIENTRLKEQADAQAVLQYRLDHDSLTGIYSRDIFCKETSKMLVKNPKSNYILVSFDIEKIKLVNDLFGRKIGNEILKAIAVSLKILLSGNGTYARLESDRFAACFSESFLTLLEFQKKINDAIKFIIPNFTVICKFGAYKVVDTEVDIDIMCDRAHMALQTVKGDYSINYVYYNDQIHETLVLEQKIISDMEEALAGKQFEIYLQPIYSLSKMKPVSAEALVRWNHPEFGMISPGIFIPIFEKNGYIAKLDYFVWEQACRFLANRAKKNKDEISVSVNVSRYTLYDPDLSNKIIKLVKKYDINPLLLKFEITESAYTDNPKQLINTMVLLQKYGFKLLMDDFGSGFSSLNLLKNLNVDILKIDMKFLEDFETSSRGGSIFTSVVRMAKWLNIPVIAEGVETKAQLEFLRGVGCDSIQGYYFSEPLSIKEFEEHLLKNIDLNIDSAPKIREEMEFDELFNGNKMLTSLFNSFVGGIGIYEFSPAGLEVIRVNDRYYEVMGYNPQTLFSEGRNILNQLYSEEDKNILIEGCKKAIKGEKVDEITIRRYHADGNTLMWLNSSIRHLGGDGEIQILCITSSDITENKKNEMLLEKQSEDLNLNRSIIQGLYNNVLCGIIQYTYDDLKILNINDEACRIQGYPNKDALYRSMQKSKEEKEENPQYIELKSYLEKYKETGKRVSFVHEFIKGDGNEGWAKGNIDIGIGFDGEKIIQCVFIDISDQKIKERESIESIRIIEDIYNNVPCAIMQFTIEKKPKLINCNEATVELYGYESFDELKIALNENVFKHLHHDEFDMANENIKTVLSSQVKRDFLYKLTRKDGSIFWAQGTIHKTKSMSGQEVLEIVFIDVTDTVQKNRQKTKINELYKLLMEDSQVIIFDYDPTEDKMNHTIFLVDGRRSEKTISNYLKTIKQNTGIHPEHKCVLKNTIKKACEKPCIGSVEYVADFNNKGYRWYRVEYKTIEDEEKNVFRFIGRAYDIQDEIQHAQALKKRAETDYLSGLLNRATAKEMIDKKLRNFKKEEKFAFLLIDIDKFKAINDEYGHLKGDEVIKEIGMTIKEEFREEDVVSRIGGDEFGVFFSIKKTNSSAFRKSTELIKKINALSEKENIDLPVSISVGIAIAPDNGDAFDMLFAKADKAMYDAKNKGGGCYCLI